MELTWLLNQFNAVLRGEEEARKEAIEWLSENFVEGEGEDLDPVGAISALKEVSWGTLLSVIVDSEGNPIEDGKKFGQYVVLHDNGERVFRVGYTVTFKGKEDYSHTAEFKYLIQDRDDLSVFDKKD